MVELFNILLNKSMRANSYENNNMKIDVNSMKQNKIVYKYLPLL